MCENNYRFSKNVMRTKYKRKNSLQVAGVMKGEDRETEMTCIHKLTLGWEK